LVAGAAARGDNWQTGVGGRASRDSVSAETGPAGPDVLWTGSVTAIVAQQAIIDGTVVVTNRITNFSLPGGTWIVAHDLHTGELLWQAQLPNDFPATSWRSRASAMRGGHVYASRSGNTNLDYLYALDVADASIIWKSDALIDESTTESLAFASDGDLVAGNFAAILRIDRETGDTVWSTPRTCPTTDGCSAAVFGDRAYIWEATASGPKVTAVNLTTGQKLYSSLPIGGGFIRQLGLMVGPDGMVYAPRTQNNPITDFFVALHDNGSALVQQWSVPMGYTPFASFGVGPDGSVYAYDAENRVIRIDPESGQVIGVSIPLRDAAEVSVPGRMAIGADGVIYVTNGGFADGRLFSFNADLSFRWSVPVTNVNVGGPALGDCGTLVVCGTGTDVRAYRTVCLGDLDCDGEVGIVDFLGVIGAWGPCPPGWCPADLDDSGVVDITDFLGVIAAWGPCA
jgi:outer membrane protein assembly factor BamB